jgi:hypothetical protein
MAARLIQAAVVHRMTETHKSRSESPSGAAPAKPDVAVAAAGGSAARILGLLSLLAIVVVVGLQWRRQAEVSAARAPGPGITTRHVFYGQPGPWGDIEYTRIQIEMPDHFVTVNQVVYEGSRWVFREHTRESVTNVFRVANLPPSQLKMVLEGSKWEVLTNGVAVSPTPELVLGLSPESRGRIYSVLSAFHENTPQAFPYGFRFDGMNDWLANSGLTAASETLVRRLFYTRGKSLVFSDLPEVLPHLATQAERVRLVKTLTRRTTVLMSLHVRPGADVTPLVNYWGRGGRAKDLQPLLDSLAQLPEGGTLDIAHLLPPFARKRIYTYPQPAEAAATFKPDCHYSSINFFNDPASVDYRGFDEFREKIDSDYRRVTGKPAYGDIFLFVRDGKEVLHSAVFIADNMLFTKNGGSAREPWVLMNLEDLKSIYPGEKPIEIVVLRLKGT